MKAELRSLDCPDLDYQGLDAPPDLDNFYLNFGAGIGPAGKIGKEFFQIQVCTPRWLVDELEHEPYLFGRLLLIVSHWDMQVIRGALEALCERTEGDTWDQIAEKLTRFTLWEFDEYRE